MILMLDSRLRRVIDGPLDRLAAGLARCGLGANAVTVAENAGTVTINVNRTGTLTLTNTVPYSFKVGSATAAESMRRRQPAGRKPPRCRAPE